MYAGIFVDTCIMSITCLKDIQHIHIFNYVYISTRYISSSVNLDRGA